MTAMVIAFASAKGGAGKTVTAASLGIVLAAVGRRVLLVDTDASTNGMTLLYIEHVVEAKSAKKRVRFWDAASGEPLDAPLLGDSGRVSAVAMGRLRGREVIVSGSDDGTVRIWDTVSGRPLGVPLTGHGDRVSAVAIGRVREKDIVVSGSVDGTVRTWEAASGRPLGGPLTGNAGRVSDVALGRIEELEIIVSGGEDGTVRTWDAESGRPLAVGPVASQSGGVSAVAVGRLQGREVIVSGGDDATVWIWDAASGKALGDPLFGHTGRINALTIGQVGEREVIVSGSDDGTVRIWEAASGRPVGVPMASHSGRVTAVAMGQVGERAVIVSGSENAWVRIWDAASGEALGDPMAGHAGRVSVVTVDSSQGRDVVVAISSDDGPLAGVFDPSTEAPRPLPIRPLLDLVPATYVMRQTEGMAPGVFQAVLKTVLERYQGEYDFVILDAQAGSDVYAVEAVGRADRAVIVSEYDPVSAEGVERLRHVASGAFAFERTWVLLNKVLPEFARGVGGFLEVARYLPPVPWDADVIRAFARRELAVDPERPNSYTVAIAEVARSLVGPGIEGQLREWRLKTQEAVRAPVRSRLADIEDEIRETERALVDTDAKLQGGLTRSLGPTLALLLAVAGAGLAVLVTSLANSLSTTVRIAIVAAVTGLMTAGGGAGAGWAALRNRGSRRRDLSAERLALQRRLAELEQVSAKYRTMVEADSTLEQLSQRF